MFEIDDEWKIFKKLVIKEMFLTATLVRSTKRFHPKTFL